MFTRFKTKIRAAHAPLIVPTLQFEEVEHDGTVSKKQVVKMVNICDPDYAKQNLPSVEEYSYENLLASGVNLREVNSQLLTSRERLMYEAAYLSEDTIDKLSDVLAQSRATQELDSNKPTETDSQNDQ